MRGHVCIKYRIIMTQHITDDNVITSSITSQRSAERLIQRRIM